MNAITSSRLFLPAILTMALACARPAAAATNDASKPADAATAWDAVQKSTQPGPKPESWKTSPPTDEERSKFFLPVIHNVLAKAKEFYTSYPKDTNAAKARIMEYQFLQLEPRFGENVPVERITAVEKSLLVDPSITGDDHYEALWIVAQDKSPEDARPLLKEITEGAAPAQIKDAAAGRLKRMDATGKPVDLKFTAVDGREVDLAKLHGKVVLVDFWATWCGPCVGEVPNVKKTYDAYHAKGFEIVGISLDQNKSSLTEFTAKKNMEWPQYFDGQGWKNKYAREYGIESIPTMWLVDKKGNLRDPEARGRLEELVPKLLAE